MQHVHVAERGSSIFCPVCLSELSLAARLSGLLDCHNKYNHHWQHQQHWLARVNSVSGKGMDNGFESRRLSEAGSVQCRHICMTRNAQAALRLFFCTPARRLGMQSMAQLPQLNLPAVVYCCNRLPLTLPAFGICCTSRQAMRTCGLPALLTPFSHPNLLWSHPTYAVCGPNERQLLPVHQMHDLSHSVSHLSGHTSLSVI